MPIAQHNLPVGVGWQVDQEDQPMNRTLIAAALVSIVAAGVVQAQTSTGTPQTITPRSSVEPRSSAEPTNQSAEEIIIKEKLRAAGLSGINNLMRNPDGTWQGKAVKDKTEVAVMVDTAGNVSFH
jgi:hypothetical protein